MGERVPALSWVPGAGDPARYAEIAQDHSAIHLDEELARAEGLPGVVLHGMHVLGQVVSHLDRHAPPGRMLGAVRMRFLDVSLPEERIKVNFEAQGGTIVFEGFQGNRSVLGAGLAVFDRSRDSGAGGATTRAR